MIYLDSAATSLYKPSGVQRAVLEAMQTMASPGRGSHQAAMRAADCCFACREALAELFHVPSPEQVVFTFNATHGLNIAIRTLARPGSRAVISGYEHNSVTRPLRAVGADCDIIDTPPFDAAAFLARADSLLPNADLAVCTYTSNVCGYVLPVREMAQLCRKYKVPLIVDASQAAGTQNIDFSALDAAFIAMPGHKGLMGPQGTGVLLCQNDAMPLLYGGSGSESILQTMPAFLPDRLEAGTQNVTGIAGLLAGVRYVSDHGCDEIRQHERALLQLLSDELRQLSGLTVLAEEDPDLQCSVLSVLPQRMSCEDLGAALEQEGVAVRTGLHCAPLAHATMGTLETGTVRFSFSPFNTVQQIRETVTICKNILKNS